MNETRKKLYDEWRETYRDDPAKAVGWRNQEALDARFNCTIRHLENLKYRNDKLLKILDHGCGTSLNLLRYLPQDVIFSYTGIDCNEESLKCASESFNIPYVEDYQPVLNSQLVKDEYLEKVGNHKFDIIISQGVYQEFDTVSAIRENVKKLSEMLNRGGELLIMTPSNRVLDAEGRSVLKISSYDAVSILEYVGLPYELFLGELGEHLIMRIYRK